MNWIEGSPLKVSWRDFRTFQRQQWSLGLFHFSRNKRKTSSIEVTFFPKIGRKIKCSDRGCEINPSHFLRGSQFSIWEKLFGYNLRNIYATLDLRMPSSEFAYAAAASYSTCYSTVQGVLGEWTYIYKAEVPEVKEPLLKSVQLFKIL